MPDEQLSRDADPEFRRALERAAMNGAAPPVNPSAPLWVVAGHCPKCGGPIWISPAQGAVAEHPPRHYYACPCAQLVYDAAKSELKLRRELEGSLAAQQGPLAK